MIVRMMRWWYIVESVQLHSGNGMLAWWWWRRRRRRIHCKASMMVMVHTVAKKEGTKRRKRSPFTSVIFS